APHETGAAGADDGEPRWNRGTQLDITRRLGASVYDGHHEADGLSRHCRRLAGTHVGLERAAGERNLRPRIVGLRGAHRAFAGCRRTAIGRRRDQVSGVVAVPSHSILSDLELDVWSLRLGVC